MDLPRHGACLSVMWLGRVLSVETVAIGQLGSLTDTVGSNGDYQQFHIYDFHMDIPYVVRESCYLWRGWFMCHCRLGRSWEQPQIFTDLHASALRSK